MAWGTQTTACKLCGKGLKKCRCRRDSKGQPARSEPKAGHTVVRKHNQGNNWCSSCGCLVRNGKCVSATCGKAQ